MEQVRGRAGGRWRERKAERQREWKEVSKRGTQRKNDTKE